ncbi:SH3 domain-containing protein [Actinomyces oris]|uniref:SH3 domain-containing protein n=1 Tax=Actinomyces oris TaxID=544580 RepID=A0AAW9KNG7_9ACTO|nr:SH3 domain-containing protein [Actinomyces oris]MEA1303933.1 SH3 domain-containing protein [Actinomyces oris]
MCTATSKIKRFALFGLATALATGATTVAPPARADGATATVYSAPGWNYANVRPSPGTDRHPIAQIQAGRAVELDCYQYGGEANGPYGSSTLWYRIKGYDEGWVANSMLSTGSDLPVTSECSAVQEVLHSAKGVAKSMGGWLVAGVLVVSAVLVRLRRNSSNDTEEAHSIPLLEKLRR